MSYARAIVLGAGNFGTALAHHLSKKGVETILWAREPAVADSINKNQYNPKYLINQKLLPTLKATSELTGKHFEGKTIVVLAIPTQFIRPVLSNISQFFHKDNILVCAAKGIELSSLKMPLSIVSEEIKAIPQDHITVLSGPSFAVEVAAGQPTAVSVASINIDIAKIVQGVFHTDFFRVYTSTDPIGLEVAGALKNVIALASGATSGLGLQNNAQAALLTRGLAEITRFGIALGAQPITFNGLGGVGDLFLTCTSIKSRNFRVGFEVGQGKKLTQVIEELGSVAEGVTTSQAAMALAKQLNVDAPITLAVYKVIYENLNIKQAVAALLGRDMKPEVTF